MTFTVYYTDDRQHCESVEANTHEMAAWKFVQAHPRGKPSQLAVILATRGRKQFGEVVVWWSSAFTCNQPPSDDAEPEIKLIATGEREPGYEICGTPESLKLLATQLLHALEQHAGQPASTDCIYSLSLDHDGLDCWLSFYPDRERKEDSPTSEWTIRIILLLLLSLLAIGIITVIGWII